MTTRIATELAPQPIRAQIELAQARTPRPASTIDAATGRAIAPTRPATGVQEAFNATPFAMRPGWRLTFKVRGVDHEITYDCTSHIEALTRLAVDYPEAYAITHAAEEVPIQT